MFSDLTLEAKFDAISPYDPFLGRKLHHVQNLVKGVWDFAVQGGAASTISLLDDLGYPILLPPKAVITRSWFEILTTFTSGGSATIAVGAQTTVDIKAATAVATWTAGNLEGIQTGAASLFSKVTGTAALPLTITIAVAALTAGKANFFVHYVISN